MPFVYFLISDLFLKIKVLVTAESCLLVLFLFLFVSFTDNTFKLGCWCYTALEFNLIVLVLQPGKVGRALIKAR